jgi:translation initiation factor IF-3
VKGTSETANTPQTPEQRVNDRIWAKEVRLIGPDRAQMGIRSTQDALAAARAMELDLVEVSATSQPPVCRIMDYGKYRFEEDQRVKENRRRARQRELKEMRFGIRIGPGDLATKTRKIREFLDQGHKVKVILRFRRGREMGRIDIGRQVLTRVLEELPEAKVESPPRLDGAQMVMLLSSSGVRRPHRAE